MRWGDPIDSHSDRSRSDVDRPRAQRRLSSPVLSSVVGERTGSAQGAPKPGVAWQTFRDKKCQCGVLLLCPSIQFEPWARITRGNGYPVQRFSCQALLGFPSSYGLHRNRKAIRPVSLTQEMRCLARESVFSCSLLPRSPARFLRLQPRDRPSALDRLVQKPIVQAAWTAQPELESAGLDTVSAPRIRQRYV